MLHVEFGTPIMAEGVSSPSVGVRIFLIVTLLCLSWLSNGSVNAADNTDIGPQVNCILSVQSKLGNSLRVATIYCWVC